MPSYGMLCRVAPEKTDVSDERVAPIIRVIGIGELGKLALTSNQRKLRRNARRLLVTSNVPSSPIIVTLMMGTTRSSETSDFAGSTRRNIPEDGILHSHRREHFKSYIVLTGGTL
jgi:hypothetical protein